MAVGIMEGYETALKQQNMGQSIGEAFSPTYHDNQLSLEEAHTPLDETGALARVVAIEADQVWLEPMQTGSCGGCASAAMCGSKGIGTLANRLEARRFAVRGQFGLRIGDSVLVAFGDKNLVKAAAVAYAIPLLLALVTAAIVQNLVGQDGWTMLGALGGMAVGFALMKFLAARLEARGALQARIIRQYEQAIHFSPKGAQCDA